MSTVTVCGGLGGTGCQLPKASDSDRRSGCGPRHRGTDSATGALVTEALPGDHPPTLRCGSDCAAVYCTLIVHAAPSLQRVRSIGCTRRKVPAADLANRPGWRVMVSVAIAAPPLFTTVRSRVATVPVGHRPNARGEEAHGDHGLSADVAGWNSTAPISAGLAVVSARDPEEVL